MLPLTSRLQAPSTGRIPVHTQRFAFHAPQEHDESVKMSNPTRGRASALPLALTAVVPRAACPQKRQFLFNTNELLFRSPNFATRTKQNTSFFLLSTNEPSPIHTHQSPIPSPQSWNPA